ncbi:MAG: 3-oxoadipate enol-lactonase, partial [Pseudomonadota bacterium]
GMINRRFAMDHAGRVSALAILNSPHDRGDEAQALVEARARKVREQGAHATLDDALKRWFTPAYLASGDGVQMVREWRAMVDPESYAQAAWVLANGVRELIRPPEAVRVPTLVMTCENDTGSTVKMCHDIASEIDGSETVIIPKLQHLGLMEQPSDFTSPVLDFLGRTLK